jgi:hypothetical protein
MKTRSENLNNLIHTHLRETLLWSIRNILGITNQYYLDLGSYWVDVVEKLVYNHGPHGAIIKLKAIRLHVTRYLCGDPLLTNSVNVRVDKSGIPSILGPLKVLVTSQDPGKLRFLMTLLILSRAIKGGHKDPDFSPLIQPSKSTED